MTTELSYRRSSHIVCFWEAGQFVFYNYATGHRSGASGLGCDVLEFFTEWQTVEALAASRTDVDAATWQQFVDALVAATLLKRSDLGDSDAERHMSLFDRWNPEAGFFHMRTKDVVFIPQVQAYSAAREQARVWPMPRAVKRYADAQTVPLPVPTATSEIERTLMARRTSRQFGVDAIELATLSRILAFAAGVQEWISLEGQGEVALKTAPSGGARHPVEVYIAAWNVTGLAPGLYHYASDEHVLEFLRGDIGANDIPRYFPNGDWYAGCGAVFLFTAVYERDLWRYAYSRAYRAPLVEVGHVAQSVCLLATECGLATFVLMGLADTEIEHDLGIDGISESVLYAAGIGSIAPVGHPVVQVPGFQPPKRRRNPFMVPRAERTPDSEQSPRL